MVRATRLIALAALAALFVPALATGGAAAEGGNVTAYRASEITLGGAGAIEDGRLQSADNVVVGDTLVAVVDDERLAATLNASEGLPTDRFFAALAGDADFRILQTNPTTMRPRMVAPLGPDNVTVYRAGTRTYLRIDTGDLTFRFRGSGNVGEATIHGGERFALEFGYDLPEEPSRAREPPEPVVAFYPTEDELPETATATATATPTATPTPTATVTRTASPTPTTSATPTRSATASPTPETTTPSPTNGETVPGFGIVATLAAVALLLAWAFAGGRPER